nr:DEAD box family helicase [Cryptococcus depauperatus CBS 7855]
MAHRRHVRLLVNLCFNAPTLSLGYYTIGRPLRSKRWQYISTSAVKQPPQPMVDKTENKQYDGSPRSSNVMLRPYQEAAISACLTALASGLRRIGVSSPTGSGKTTMFMSLIPQIPFYSKEREEAVSKGKRGQTLVVVSSVELAAQAEQSARQLLNNDWTIEVEQSRRKATGLADVTIATYQTLNNPDRLAKFDPSQFKLIIVDEAHHAAAHSYLRLLHYFNQQVNLPSSIEPHTRHDHGHHVPIIGFSATFSRSDHLALSSVFEEIVYHQEISTMLKDGWLAPAKSTTVAAHLDLEKVELNQSGDFKSVALARKVNTPEVNELVVRTYLYLASQRRSTLVFCVDLSHVDALTQVFISAGIDARSVSSLSRPEFRKSTIAAFSAGEFPVLLNCEVLTEGTDIPQIDCVLLARPTKSRSLLAQMVGRGLRLSPDTGKTDCHIIDVVDSVSSANGMIVAPTLLGLSHEEMERRESKSETSKTGTEPQPDKDLSTKTEESSNTIDYEVTFSDQDDPFQVDSNSRPIVEKISQYAWVSCGKRKYILELLGHGQLIITPSNDLVYEISFRPSIPPELAPTGRNRSPYGKTRVVGHAANLERALQAGDKFAERQLGRERCLQMKRNAPWRHKPASERAIKLLMKLIGHDNLSLVDSQGNGKMLDLWGKKVSVHNLTAGQVSSWLCARKNGAKSVRMAKDKAEERRSVKEAQIAEKERLLQQRNLPFPLST